jgi:mycoredoxin
MTTSNQKNIRLYTSRWCAHSLSVERFLDRNNVVVEKINVDGDSTARDELVSLNSGYASVPTLLFPDGTKLTEPAFSEIRRKLNLEPSPSLVKRIKSAFGQDESED